MTKKSMHKAFTLVEMLIVIVIIGILAAALIPRLQGMQGRARDTARKADLNQLGTAFTVYQADNGSMPGGGGDVTAITTLVPAYMSSLPTDPNKSRVFFGVSTGAAVTPAAGTGGSYRYIPISKNGKANNAIVIMAGTEEAGSSSNYIYDDAAANAGLTSVDDYDSVRKAMCKTITRGAATVLSTCTVNKDKDSLRYIYAN